MRGRAAVLLAAVLVSPAAALAADHANLDQGHPMRFEDPYPVPRGEWSVELGGSHEDQRSGQDLLRRWSRRLSFPVDVLHGVALNAQISAGVNFEYFTGTDSAFGNSFRVGDLRISGLYNFTQETTGFPALGLAYTLELPTGTNSEGVDTELKALVTKSIGRVSFHANLSECFVGERVFGERHHRFGVDLGTSLTLGATRTRNLFLAGWSTEQAPFPGVENLTRIGVGLRRQQTARTVLDVGVGRDSGGWGSGARLRIGAGLSRSY